MSQFPWDDAEVRETIGGLAMLADTVARATRITPTAMMLPLSLAPGLEAFRGTPIVRGDRAALIYEPPKVGA